MIFTCAHIQIFFHLAFLIIDKHLKKTGGHISRNGVEITIKMKTIVRKPLMIRDFVNAERMVILVQKISSRSFKFCACILALLPNQRIRACFKFRDISQKTIFDLLRKTWSIKTLNNFRRLYPPKKLEIQPPKQFDSSINQQIFFAKFWAYLDSIYKRRNKYFFSK